MRKSEPSSRRCVAKGVVEGVAGGMLGEPPIVTAGCRRVYGRPMGLGEGQGHVCDSILDQSGPAASKIHCAFRVPGGRSPNGTVDYLSRRTTVEYYFSYRSLTAHRGSYYHWKVTLHSRVEPDTDFLEECHPDLPQLGHFPPQADAPPESHSLAVRLEYPP